MNSNLFLMEFVFLFSLMTFFFLSNHFIMMLLMLEMMSMSILFIVLFNSNLDSSTIILFITMMVLEAAFGLSLMVSNSRKLGGDFLISIQ